MRRGIAAILVAGLVIGTGQARAANLATVGCAAQGYTMQVPGYWTVAGACTASSSVKDPLGMAVLQVHVERHGFWSDARSRASILADITHAVAATSGVITSGIDFQPITTHAHRFLTGLAEATWADGTQIWVAEQETFSAGYMYKFTALAHHDDSTVKLIGSMWGTIQITRHP